MTNEVLNGKDILKMAVAIEERGAAYYTQAAQNFKEQKISRTFLKLAEEEKEHARFFRKLFEELKEEHTPYNPQTAKYIKSILESTVFPQSGPAGELLSGIEGPREVLQIGIQTEKDAILFYHELYENITDKEARGVLSKLLEEEKMHLVDLREYLEDL